MIVGIAGKMASGKDTYAKELIKTFPDVVTYSYARPLKDEVNNLINDIKNNEQNLDLKYNVTIDEIYHAKTIIKPLIEQHLTADDRSPEVRKILQYWGTNVRRNQDADYWVKKTIEKVLVLEKEHNIVCITDMRFLNEIKALADINALTIRLDVSKEEQKKRLMNRDNIDVSEEALNHPSETEFLKYKHFDVILDTEQWTPDIICDLIAPFQSR